MVKPLSAGCVNTVGACALLTRNKELTLCGIKTVCVGRSLMNCAMKEEREVSLFSGVPFFSKRAS